MDRHIAERVIEECRLLASCSEEPGFTTRTFLSGPMHAVHSRLSAWMQKIGMTVRVDAAGNRRGVLPSGVLPSTAGDESAQRLFIGSHLDTVPHAGAFDGILGVVMAIALVEGLAGRRLKYPLEIVGFSEEEGVRFGVPFIGSRALAGFMDDELHNRIDQAIRNFGLDPSKIPDARVADGALGYLEFHIEQGPVLESLGHPLGIVETIAGQSRFEVVFIGKANHAGTTPMNLRHDALAAAAEWIGEVERRANATAGLVATVGRLNATPGADNVIAGRAAASLDVRHAGDATRQQAVADLLNSADRIAARRNLTFSVAHFLDQPAVTMDPRLIAILERSVAATGHARHKMSSGAGHDAMIMARRMPAAMLFVRSPGGISHHPDEAVLAEDVAAALAVGMNFLEQLEAEV